jgi:Flp pilus assembly protein CpaB
MRRGGRILILLGIVLGGITAVVAFFVLSTRTSSEPAVTRTHQVVVAQQNIPMHAPIPVGAMLLVDWPDDVALPRDAYSNMISVTNKLSATPIEIGQVMVTSMIIDKAAEEIRKGLGSDAALIVPKGKVAVAFPINQISGVSAALKDGDNVDLLVSYDLLAGAGQVSGVTKKQVTQVALQDVEILRVGPWSTGTAAADTSREASNLTFLVTRQDALVLKFLRETATEVQLALRAAGDHEIVSTEPVINEYVDQRFKFNGLLLGKAK